MNEVRVEAAHLKFEKLDDEDIAKSYEFYADVEDNGFIRPDFDKKIFAVGYDEYSKKMESYRQFKILMRINAAVVFGACILVLIGESHWGILPVVAAPLMVFIFLESDNPEENLIKYLKKFNAYQGQEGGYPKNKDVNHDTVRTGGFNIPDQK